MNTVHSVYRMNDQSQGRSRIFLPQMLLVLIPFPKTYLLTLSCALTYFLKSILVGNGYLRLTHTTIKISQYQNLRI